MLPSSSVQEDVYFEIKEHKEEKEEKQIEIRNIPTPATDATDADQEKRNWYMIIADVFYDIFACALSLVDVISDILVAREFYNEGHMEFFYVAVAIFVIATISYTIMFCALYTNTMKFEYTILTAICVFPFGQLVPTFIWLQQYHFEWLDSFLNYFNFYVGEDDSKRSKKELDPLYNYILRKIQKHGGFYLEAIVESVPQSILQMVAIVVLNRATPINVFSITVSMISVASKGIVLSYSINRSTFAFNFLCFVADIFNIFCTVSWLSLIPSSVPLYPVPFFPSLRVPIFTLIWFYKELTLIGIVLGTCAICLSMFLLYVIGRVFYVTFDVIRRAHCRRQNCIACTSCCGECLLACLKLIPECCGYGSDDCRHTFLDHLAGFLYVFCIILCAIVGGACALAFGLCLLPAFATVIEALKLSTIPIFLNGSLDFEHSRAMSFFGPLFDWFQEGDFDNKMKDFNKHAAKSVVMENGLHSSRSKVILALPNDQLSLQDFRDLQTLSFRSIRKSYANEMRQIMANSRADAAYSISVVNYLQICLVCVLLGILYSVLFPILCFFSTPNVMQYSLQAPLSIIYLCVIGLILCQLPWVITFKRATIHMVTSYTMYSEQPTFQDMLQINSVYTGRLVSVLRDTWIHERFPDDIANIVIGYLPDLHLVNLPHISTDDVPDVCGRCTGRMVDGKCFCTDFKDEFAEILEKRTNGEAAWAIVHYLRAK